MEGAVSVVGSDDRPTLAVSELAGAPLQVRHQGGDLVPGPDGLGRARLPEASDLEVSLQSTSGQVATAFEQLGHEHTPGRHAARGRLRAGGGRLKASSTSGHVALLRRAPEATL